MKSTKEVLSIPMCVLCFVDPRKIKNLFSLLDIMSFFGVSEPNITVFLTFFWVPKIDMDFGQLSENLWCLGKLVFDYTRLSWCYI